MDPAYATAHHWYGAFGLPALQRTEEALEEIREAERLDPLSAPIANDVGFVLYWSRRFDEAIEQCRKTIALHPGFYRAQILLGRVLAAQGRYAESVESCLKARERMESASFLPYLLGTLGFAYASSGNARPREKSSTNCCGWNRGVPLRRMSVRWYRPPSVTGTRR